MGALKKGWLARFGPGLLRAAVGVAALVGALVFTGFLVSTKPTVGRKAFDAVVPRVRCVTLRRVDVRREWQGWGGTRAMSASDVASELTARVVERGEGIEDGVAVRRGQVLVRLERDDFESRLTAARERLRGLEAEFEWLSTDQRLLTDQLEYAEEELKSVQWQLDAVRRAMEQGAGNNREEVRLVGEVARIERQRSLVQQLLDRVPFRRMALSSDIAVLRSEVEQAERNVGRTEITSPIDGYVQRITVYAGETVGAGQVVARVVDLRRIEASVKVAASAFGSIRLGDEAEIRAEGLDLGVWTGRVARVSPEADAESRTVTVYVEVEQEVGSAGLAVMGGGSDGAAGDGTVGMNGDENVRGSGLLLPGRFVTCRLWSEGRSGRLLVPRAAVVDDRVMVAVGDDDETMRCEQRTARVLYHVDGRWDELDPDETEWAVLDEAASSVREGDRVITTNLDGLTVGARVSAVGGAERGEAEGTGGAGKE